MPINIFFTQLEQNPEQVEFSDTMAIIDNNYSFTPSSFSNGNILNEALQNNGSCKIFAFALLNQLSEQQTLACFGHYYRDDVLKNPTGDDHQNIRNFILSGWNGIKFHNEVILHLIA